MSDYVSGLRQDLVEAAARQQAAGRGARVARPLRPRAWSPVVVLGAAAALAAALVLVVGLRAVTPAAAARGAEGGGRLPHRRPSRATPWPRAAT